MTANLAKLPPRAYVKNQHPDGSPIIPGVEAEPEPAKSAAKLPKYVVYIQAADPYGRNFVANFEVEGVTVRGRDREDVNTRADWLAAILGAE